MNIAVNTRFFIPGTLEGYGYFVKEVFLSMAQQHPEHQFYFLFDRPYDPQLVFPGNVTPIVVSPPARHPLLWKYWYDLKIPLVLRKIKADVFVSPDGQCSLTTKVPQCIVVHDLAIIHNPEAFQKAHTRYYKHYTPQFLKKAKAIATVSQFSKDDMVNTYKIAPVKIDVVYSAVKEAFRPIPYEEQMAVKEKWTEGREYFIYVGAIQPRKNLLNLLKAFSIFKKRLQTGMKLVLAGRLAWKNDEFLQLLKTYKYRDDVVLTNYVEEKDLVGLVASAYALVYPSFFEGFGVPVLEGMASGVPVLTSSGTSMQEIGGAAAFYFDPNDPATIAERLMRIYKDETLRSRLVELGKEVASQYSWARTAGLLWESVEKAAGT